jgi:hypothetical protein
VQFTVRLPRWSAIALAIVIGSLAVSVLLPAVASGGSAIVVCIDTDGSLTVSPSCTTGQTLTWNQTGVAGTNGVAGATGATGPEGPIGPATHLLKTKPQLAAKIEATIDVQTATLKDVNGNIRDAYATTAKLRPSLDPTTAAIQAEVNVQAASITRLINVMRGLAHAQTLLLQGIQ